MSEPVEARYQAILKRYWGYDSFRPLQLDAIKSIASGQDTLVLMPTGGGKSIIYQVPTLASTGVCIVITPLIALMKDQVDRLRKHRILAEAIHAGRSHREIDRILDNCIYGDVKFLYISPERIDSEMFRMRCARMDVALIAVDEAHCISQWGYDFRPSYLQIARLRDLCPNTPILALTASATPKVAEDIMYRLRFDKPNIKRMSFARSNLSYVVRHTEDKREHLLRIVNNVSGSGIVYVRTREKSETIAQFLQQNGITADFYHGGLGFLSRNLKQEQWINGQNRIMVATNAFGMGIDKADVRFVIHYDICDSLEAYYQEAGRAGRDGLPSNTVLFYSLGDLILLTKFASESNQQNINLEKLQRMQQYAEADICRRRILLSYFGETTTEDCGNCDVCKNPPQRFDGTVIVQKALSAIARTEQQISTGVLIDILRGNYSAEVTGKGYQELKTFGAGRDIPPRDWQDYLLQMLQLGYFEIAYNENNHLKITSSGSNVLFGRTQAALVVIQHEEAVTRKGKKKKVVIAKELPFGAAGGESQDLFEALRGLRKQLADQEALPAYIVLSDKVLHLLCISRPTTIEEFGEISGIGEHKKKKYGKDFVNLIRQFVE